MSEDTEAATSDRAERYAETVARLDEGYPNGWRCGDPTTDAITVVLADGLRQMLGGMFGSGKPQSRRSELLTVLGEAEHRNLTDAQFHAEVDRAALVVYEAMRGVNPPQTERDHRVAATAAAVALYLRDGSSDPTASEETP